MTKDDIKVLKGAVREISNSMTRAEAERDFQRDAINDTADKLQLDKKVVRQLARIYHKQNFTDVQAETEEVVSLYESISA